MSSREKEGAGSHRLTLLQRIVGLVALGLLVIGLLQVWYSERVIEEAMLQQVQQQALVFLLGVEREMQSLPGSQPSGDEAAVEEVLHRAAHYETDELHFAILSLYLYDLAGNIVAHEPPGEFSPKPLDGRYGDVLRSGVPYIGEVEYQEGGSKPVPAIDIILPVHRDGLVVGGLEVELDLGRTMEMIRTTDDRYESELTLMLAAAGALLLALVWGLFYSGLVLPVRVMGRITRRIADGDLRARVARPGQDELGVLGSAIDKMADSIEELFDAQEQAYIGALQSLAKALEAKDAYTASHSGRVARFSVMLGKRVGLEGEQIKLLKQGALMHDLGKIGIPDAILNKPGALEDHEYEVMQSHPELTDAIMRPLKRFKAFSEIARSHHERWDGKGYPDGLKGEAIPILARIVSIADTWDAMTGDRVYRKGMPVEKALSILEKERGSGQWDPWLIGEFIELIGEESAARREIAADMGVAETS